MRLLYDLAMPIGIITGSGTYALPALANHQSLQVQTTFGEVQLTRGRIGETDVVHLSRHGEKHTRLSSQVNHRANVLALKDLEVDAIIGVTVCGAVDSSITLGSTIVFDDIHFPVNRLPDGSLCTLHTQPGVPGRGHWIFERPFSEPLRQVLLQAAASIGSPARDGGCYGHVDGPRFNTRSEIRLLASAGVSAVSQTAGAEAVLCGEAEIPYGLIGYATDYANGVTSEPTPVSELTRLMSRSTGEFASILGAALPLLADIQLEPTGMSLRWE
jgi:purine nucleoside phosphorylase